MSNLGDLLGPFMRSTMSKSGEDRLGNLLQGLQTNLGSVVSRSGGAGGTLGKVFDIAKATLGNASQNPIQAAGIGAVLGSILGGGSKSISGAVQGGALALLAGVAYQALTNAAKGGTGTSASGTAPPVDEGGLQTAIRGPETAVQAQALERKAELIIKGMINVAKADGQVGADEIQRIVGRLKEAGMQGDTETWILAELRRPLDLDAFVSEIPSRELAAEVYAASLLAVKVDTPQERAYLNDLAAKTGIAGPVAEQIQQALGVSV